MNDETPLLRYLQRQTIDARCNIACITSTREPPTMTILPVYAALLALLFVYLSVRTIRTRRSRKVALGHADDPAMLRAMRVHGNFAEYVPFALLLIYFVESSSHTPWLIHLLGCSLLLGRLCHAFGMSRTPENFRYRVVGMALTFTVILISATYIMGTALIP